MSQNVAPASIPTNAPSVTDNGCISPYTFADGTSGYSHYNAKGERVKKERFKKGETLESIAKQMSVPISDFPPGARVNERKAQKQKDN